MEKYNLIQKQSLPLKAKIEMSKRRIRTFYDKMNGNVYISFSGGKDSTVLLNLVRSMYPNVLAVFVDTGLEYPEIREFVKTINNVTWIKPKMSFIQVIRKYGYPIISKEQSMYIRQYRTTKSNYLKNVRWNGKGKHNRFKISEKWKFLVNAPFQISETCCDVMKKRPIHLFEKEKGLKPFIGNMASDSQIRERQYLKNGCNILREGKEKSMPLSFWIEKDVWDYIKQNKLSYCPIYDEGLNRTGCVYCMFGIHKETENRFEILKILHPNLYNYCMNKLGIRKVLNYLEKGGLNFTQNSLREFCPKGDYNYRKIQLNSPNLTHEGNSAEFPTRVLSENFT